MPIVWNAEAEAKVRAMSLSAIRCRDKPTRSTLAAITNQPIPLASRRSVQSLRHQGRHPAAQRAR